jgi:hypothetical protein
MRDKRTRKTDGSMANLHEANRPLTPRWQAVMGTVGAILPHPHYYDAPGAAIIVTFS